MSLKPLILATIIAISYCCLFNHIYLFWAALILLVALCIIDSKKDPNDPIKI